MNKSQNGLKTAKNPGNPIITVVEMGTLLADPRDKQVRLHCYAKGEPTCERDFTDGWWDMSGIVHYQLAIAAIPRVQMGNTTLFCK